MPTTIQEIVKMKNIIDEYVEPYLRSELFARLYEEVGKNSVNLSVELSLKMLDFVYNEASGLTWEDKLDHLNKTFESYYNMKWYNPKRWIMKWIL